MDAVRTVVITIESTNENPIDASKESVKGVAVYTYKGEIDDVSCGRTYVSDIDDWDLADKNFQCIGGCVDQFTYFT